MSGSGPLAPIFQGVWQSLQPMVVTRYFPRSMGEVGEGVDASAAADPIAPGPPAEGPDADALPGCPAVTRVAIRRAIAVARKKASRHSSPWTMTFDFFMGRPLYGW